MKKTILFIIQFLIIKGLIAQATLPVYYTGGWQGITETGWTEFALAADGADLMGGSSAARFMSVGAYLQVYFNDTADEVSFYAEYNFNASNTIVVEESSDGSSWNTIATPSLADAATKYTYSVDGSARYIRWRMTSYISGNIRVDEINISRLGGSGSGSNNQVLFCYDHISRDSLFWINPNDGAVSGLQDNNGDDIMAMAYDYDNELTYGFTHCATSGNPKLQIIDMKNFTVTSPRSYTNTVFFGAAYDNIHKILYAVGMENGGNNVPQTLYEINTTTGDLTAIGSLGLPGSDDFCSAYDDGIDGLAYDRSTSTLFGASYNGDLYSINPSTGAATFIGTISPKSMRPLRGLTYDYNNNILYAVDQFQEVYEVDKTTGNVTRTIPAQGSFSCITALAYTIEGTVPVEMTFFTGKRNENSVTLNWETASERNSDYYIVQRKENGVFIPIGNVRAAGNSNTVRKYSFTDNNAPVETAYYRLKQVDLDGKYEYSKVISVTGNKDKEIEILRDNDNNLLIISGSNSGYTVFLYDATGKTILSRNYNAGETARLDVSHLHKGQYFVRILTGDGENYIEQTGIY